jgi:hypothetical protein
MRPGRRVFAWLAVLILAGVLFLPVIQHWHDTGDFAVHSMYALRILESEPGVLNTIPNFLYHLSLILVLLVAPGLAAAQAVIIAAEAWYLLLAGIIFALIRPAIAPQSWPAEFVTIGLTLVLLLVAPLYFLTPENTYFGYLAPYVYHNPTMLPLRALALPVFFAAASVFTLKTPAHFSQRIFPILAIAALTIACILAKPSFLMILLPALMLVTAIQLLRRQPVDGFMLLSGIVIPGGLLLAYQAATNTRGGLAFSPLTTVNLWAEEFNPLANQNVLLKILLSTAFPLSVYAAYFRQARGDVPFNLALLCAAIGAGFAYLLIDTGEPSAGNLVWNGQIGVFVLFIAAALFWLKQARREIRFGVCGMILALHVLCGIAWYALNLSADYPAVLYKLW